MCFNQRGDISTLNGSSLKLVDKFIYLGSSVSSTKTNINMRLAKTWTASDMLLVIWKLDLTDKIKRSFLQAAVVSVLLYGCTTLMLTKHMEKKLDGKYTRMLRAILNKSWRATPHKTAAVRPLTTQRRWTIGRSSERGSGISVLVAQHDDDDMVSNIPHNTSRVSQKFCNILATWRTIWQFQIPLTKLWK